MTPAGWHPDRVASLTVLSTPHPAALFKALRTSKQSLLSWYMGLSAGGFGSAYAREVFAGQLTGALNWYRGIPFSRRPPLGRITVPTTYSWGLNDVVLARAAVQLTADHVAGPYEVVELDAGHWLPETEPDAVAAGILARVRSTTTS